MSSKKKTGVIFALTAAIAASITAICLFLKRRRKGIFYALSALLFCGFMFGGAMTVYGTKQEAEQYAAAVEADDHETDYYADHYEIYEVLEIIIGADVEIDLSDFLNIFLNLATLEPPSREGQPFTPPGNLSLVDDFDGAQAQDKQFITVTTRNGNIFYIIIDRASETDNVHFLNQVDEFDLLQILQGEDAEPPPLPLPPGMLVITPEVPTEYDPDEANGGTNGETPAPQPRQNNTTQILLMLGVVGLIGGGAFYYFKVLKPKQAAKKPTVKSELDEFDFDPDEDDLFSDSAYTDTDTDEQEDGADFMDDEDMPDFTAADEESEDK